jgi:semaphorin 6
MCFVIGSKLPSSQEKLPIYTAETLSIAVTTSCLAALVVGFVSGFLFSRRCRGEDYSNMPYPEQRHQLNRYCYNLKLLALCHMLYDCTH